MATIREATIVSSQLSNPVRFTTSASTFGELKNEFSNNGISYNSDLKVALRNGSETIVLTESSVLPENSFIIMMTPKKVKSGRS